MIKLPPYKYLHECFILRKDGRLVWRERPASHFNGWYGHKGWNKKYAGRIADVAGGIGYYLVCINGKRFKSHRIVYCMANNVDPLGMQIDHINCNRGDNRPENLRTATQSQNTINFKGARKDNTHGGRGVTWNKKNKKWEAHAQKDGKRKYLGIYSDKKEALLVASRARKELFGEFFDGGEDECS